MATIIELVDLREILAQFQIKGQLLDITPNHSGHINETYLSRFANGKGVERFVHQRINHHVFKEPEKVMLNIERVTRHAREKIIARGGDPNRETLNIVPARDGASFYRDAQGNCWRTYYHIQGARTYDVVADLRHVYSAAYAFGKFQTLLSDLPGERLFETIPNFHNTPRRYEAFLQAVENDACRRAGGARAEIQFIRERAGDMGVVVNGLADGSIPERVTHNDTKFNNVMIDDQTGKGICVIDLDTVMPGSFLYDFGDAVRVGASAAAEDEPDLSKVGMNIEMFERLAHGFLDAAGSMLTPAEKELLPLSARLMCLEVGMRFLTDYLSGDTYFRIHRPGHNLERCRTQLKMVAEIERQLPQMEAIVRRHGA